MPHRVIALHGAIGKHVLCACSHKIKFTKKQGFLEKPNALNNTYIIHIYIQWCVLPENSVAAQLQQLNIDAIPMWKLDFRYIFPLPNRNSSYFQLLELGRYWILRQNASLFMFILLYILKIWALNLLRFDYYFERHECDLHYFHHYTMMKKNKKNYTRRVSLVTPSFSVPPNEHLISQTNF